MSVGTNIQTINYNNINIQPKVRTNFKAQTVSVQNYPPDTVEIAGKKKKLSLGAKIAIGVGTTLAVLVGGAFAISKHQTNKLQRLYKEKLVPKIFDKELTFTEAKTKEDALKYAKDILGVKNIDEHMTLEALNYTNHGITDVVNKNIGQEVFIPRSYLYDDIDGLAHVVSSIKDKNFGELAINKKFFDNEFLTKELDKQFSLRDFAKNIKEDAKESAKKAENGLHSHFASESELVDLLDRYKANPNNLSVAEKRTLLYSFGRTSKLNALFKFDYIKFAEKNKDKIKIDIEEFKKLTRAEQGNSLDKYLKDNKMSMDYYIYLPADNGISTIYHEMGHLQDFAKNLKEIDLKFWKLPTWKESKAAVEAKKAGKTVEDRSRVDEIENRWGGTTYSGFKDLLKNNPEKFKKLYPDLYKHLKDENIQKTTMKVSWYAGTSIGEFIAEVYKMMISGKEIPEDVMKLYKKYNGPLPNGFK